MERREGQKKAKAKARESKTDKNKSGGGDPMSGISSGANGGASATKKVLKLFDKMKAAVLTENKISDEDYQKMISSYNQSN